MVGLLNINKPSGMTSRRVVDIVARIAGTKRVGHAGTLDPLASGVLVVCVGWSTRLVSFVQDRPKGYSAGFLLGRRSDTDDITGQVVEVPGATVPSRGDVEAALPQFVGTILQVPPQFSAVHVAGERAHQAARRGQRVEIEPRPVNVHRIEIVEYAYPDLTLTIECGSGTYVRSIGRDLGNVLGCGAVMNSLVRTAIGEFTLESAALLSDLQSQPIDRFLLPPLQAVSHLPKWRCSATECAALLQGKAIPATFHAVGESEIAVIRESGDLFALVVWDPQQSVLRPRQVFGGASSE